MEKSTFGVPAYFNQFQFNGFIWVINPGFINRNILHRIALFCEKEKKNNKIKK